MMEAVRAWLTSVVLVSVLLSAAQSLIPPGKLGLEVTVRVETRTEGNGIPVPWSAELTGSWSQALASALETELGIPAERQVWHEREAEN